VLGPILLVVVMAAAGGAFGGWAGAVAAGATGLFVVGAVAAGAATWAARIGSLIEPEDAWEVAPRPPLFGRMVDAIYRRSLESGPPEE